MAAAVSAMAVSAQLGIQPGADHVSSYTVLNPTTLEESQQNSPFADILEKSGAISRDSHYILIGHQIKLSNFQILSRVRRNPFVVCRPRCDIQNGGHDAPWEI